MDIKETLELEAALQIITQKLEISLKSGKGLKDALLEVALDKDVDVAVVTGVEGATLIPAEIKDLDVSETIQLGEKIATDVISDIKG